MGDLRRTLGASLVRVWLAYRVLPNRASRFAEWMLVAGPSAAGGNLTHTVGIRRGIVSGVLISLSGSCFVDSMPQTLSVCLFIISAAYKAWFPRFDGVS